MDIAISNNNVPIRLTDERWMHISTGHPEIDYYYEILETIEIPEKIFEGESGEMIATGIKIENTEKFLVVIYKEDSDRSDGFIITAYLSKKLSGLEKRRLIWEQQK